MVANVPRPHDALEHAQTKGSTEERNTPELPDGNTLVPSCNRWVSYISLLHILLSYLIQSGCIKQLEKARKSCSQSEGESNPVMQLTLSLCHSWQRIAQVGHLRLRFNPRPYTLSARNWLRIAWRILHPCVFPVLTDVSGPVRDQEWAIRN